MKLQLLRPTVAQIYNLALLVGISCTSAGVWIELGRGAGLITLGVLVLALTIYGAERLSRGAR